MEIQDTYLEASRPKHYEEAYNEMPIFDSNLGVGTEWEHDGEILKAEIRGKKREVTLDIRSWVGISGGAVHCYGSLNIDGLHFKMKEGGYVSSSAQPVITDSIKIEIRRPLPEAEYLEDRERYRHYKVGDYITGFLEEKELIKFAKKVFKEKFTGNWKFKINR